jgi:hypothetical protein
MQALGEGGCVVQVVLLPLLAVSASGAARGFCFQGMLYCF